MLRWRLPLLPPGKRKQHTHILSEKQRLRLVWQSVFPSLCAQHSQSVENWCMMIPGLKVVAPSNPLDVVGLLAAAVRDPDPVIFFEHKSLYPTTGEVPHVDIVDTLGTAKIVRPGKDATICALALMVPRALEAAEKLKTEHGIDCEVVDVRSLVPLDTQTILGSVAKTNRLFTVEDNPRLCGWGTEIVSIVC